MARLTKHDLLRRVRSAIENAGWEVEVLSERPVFPIELRMSRGREQILIRLYIWNLTHGGKSRSASEFRIQVTSGVTQFARMTSEQTLILGWSEEFGAFAAFDYDRHVGYLGSSPSLQVSIHTLQAAKTHGVATGNKGNNEIVVAARPDFLADYIQYQGKLHNPAEALNQVDRLRRGSDSTADRELRYYSQLLEGRRPRYGTAAERGRRDRVLRWVSTFQQESLDLPGVGLIGHNNPPGDDTERPSAEEVQSALDDVQIELTQETPDVNKIIERTRLIDKAARTWRTLVAEAERLVDIAKEKVRERIVETILFGGLILLWQIVGGVLTWLQSLFN